MYIAIPIEFSATGAIYSGPCFLCGFLIGTDGVNDPTITFYNGTDPVLKEVVPTTTYEASVFGLNGFMPGEMQIDCPNGLYVEVSNFGTGEGVVYVRPM